MYSSILLDIMNSEDPEGGACSSPLQPRPVMQSPLASPPEGSIPGRSATSSTTNSRPFYEPVFGPTKPLSPRPMSGVLPQSDKPLSIGRESTENLHRDASLDPALNPSLDLLTVAFPSATWSSCPSPEETTPRSGSGLKLTPSASLTRLESHHWPVLPPISPVRGEK